MSNKSLLIKVSQFIFTPVLWIFFYTSSLTTSSDRDSILHSLRALNGRGIARRPITSFPLTETTKLPLPGFSTFTTTTALGFFAVISSESFLADRPNTPQDLQASMTTSPVAGEAFSEISAIFLFGPIVGAERKFSCAKNNNEI